MPLVKCPDCKKNVSSRVSQCPFCGCPAEFFEAIIQSDSENKNAEKDNFTENANKPKEYPHPEMNEINMANEDLTHVEKFSEEPMESSRISKTMQCSKCGAQLDADAVFCNQCGARVSGPFSEKTKEAAMRTCDNVGANEPSKDKVAKIVVNSSYHEAVKALYCNKCGVQLDADSTFCNQCGAPIAQM